MVGTEKIGTTLQPASHGQWSPEIARHFTDILKSLPPHADYFHRKTADHDLRPDDIWTRSEHALPRLVTENDHGFAPGRSGIFREQGTAQLRADTKHLKVVPGDQLPLKSMAVDAGIDILNGRDLGERGVVFFKLLIFIPGERMSAALTVGPRETLEAVTIADRDRAQHIRVEEGEERQVESEAKGDRSGDSEYEPRAAPETPQGIANVLQCGLE